MLHHLGKGTRILLGHSGMGKYRKQEKHQDKEQERSNTSLVFSMR
jgi:hypothetical protein